MKKHGLVRVLCLASVVCAVSACSSKAPAPQDEVITEEKQASSGEGSSEEAARDEAASEGTAAAALEAAIGNEGRAAKEKARDAYRHPAKTLAFFGVRPEHKVLELWAGRGWYSKILAPYLGERGKLYATTYTAEDPKEYLRTIAAEYKVALGKVPHGDRVVLLEVVPPKKLAFKPGEPVDVVLTFRNIHNWVKGGYEATIYEQAFAALKPGGVFGVVEHRAPEGWDRARQAKTGYVPQKQVIKDIEAVGFKFVASSEVNANPRDSKDHPEGVWTLPPRLKLGDKDRAKYEAIGESDRMTLKFIKPAGQ